MRKLLLVLLILTYNLTAQAEAWLSNRFAQNCAACHSPARRNLPAVSRRCTLSCQGCHVSPSGGGLRSQYGKWTQNKWLRSTRIRTSNKNTKTPAPLKMQAYKNHPISISRKNRKKFKKYLKNGSRLVTTNKMSPNEKYYDRSDKQEHITIKQRHKSEFMYRVTHDDPIRLKQRNYFNFGGDIRFFYMTQAGDNLNPSKKSNFWPMGLDLGAQVKPLKKYKNYLNKASLVFEGRFLNSFGGSLGDLFKKEFKTRSLYVLVDDLPFASYVMAGTYRPMFNHYTPDHENLTQTLTGLTARTAYKAVSLGGSPNVPFYNIHFISPESDTAIAQDKGLIINLGGRFVSYGASIMLSHWKTTAPNEFELDVKKSMTSLTLGAQHKRFTLLMDYVDIEKEYLPDSADKGFSNTFELRYRAYRENYLKFLTSTANVSRTLKEGFMFEQTVGISSFLLANLEIDFSIINRTNREDTLTNKRTLAFIQLHGYF